MSMRINQNVLSMSTYANLNRAGNGLENSISKLSSGLRINSAADDAAGLAISEKMRRQIKGLERAELNAQDGISMIQTAEGALSETQSIIQRMRELALQSANDTLTSNDRLEIQNEVEELKTQIDTIAESTEFNTKKLLNGNQAALVSSSSQAIESYVTGAVAGGGDYEISLATISGGISQMQRSQILTNKNSGQLCTGSTKLEDINGFYGASGEFALESAQTLTLTGNGKSSTVTLDRQMTLNEVAAALQNAVSASSGLGIANSKVQVMTETTTNETDNGGYLQITSGSIGDNGEFNIAGSQDVLDALGFSVTREAVNSMVSVSMKDAYGNSKSITTSTDRAAALLDGIDIQFKSQAAQIAGVGGMLEGLKLDSKQSFDIKVNNTDVKITVAAGNWSLEGIARSINQQIDTVNKATATLGKLDGLSASMVDGEIRINYSPALPDKTSGTAITISNASANTIGLYDGEYNGFVTGVKDSANSITGISRYNGAAEAVDAGLANLKSVISANASTAGGTLTVSPSLTGVDADFTKIFSAIGSAIVANGVTYTSPTITSYTTITQADLDALKAGINTVADLAVKDVLLAVHSNLEKVLAERVRQDNLASSTLTLQDASNLPAVDIGFSAATSSQSADLMEIKEFIASVNSKLQLGGQNIRADAVNGSLAFTSTMLGTDNDLNGAIKSSVKLSYDSEDTETFKALGLHTGTAYGAGDTNFKLHVVNAQAQFQIGADAGDNMRIGIADMSTKALGLDKIDLTSVDGAEKSLEKLNQALDKVSSERSKLGAYQNRLEYTISNLQNTNTNLTSAESRIRDVDMASEMIEFTRNQIVTQAATSMLAQANSIPQNALSLLG
ncbi:MAG: flagellin [Candidatus Ozemobacteraceae bacterium]